MDGMDLDTRIKVEEEEDEKPKTAANDEAVMEGKTQIADQVNEVDSVPSQSEK